MILQQHQNMFIQQIFNEKEELKKKQRNLLLSQCKQNHIKTCITQNDWKNGPKQRTIQVTNFFSRHSQVINSHSSSDFKTKLNYRNAFCNRNVFSFYYYYFWEMKWEINNHDNSVHLFSNLLLLVLFYFNLFRKTNGLLFLFEIYTHIYMLCVNDSYVLFFTSTEFFAPIKQIFSYNVC